MESMDIGRNIHFNSSTATSITSVSYVSKNTSYCDNGSRHATLSYIQFLLLVRWFLHLVFPVLVAYLLVVITGRLWQFYICSFRDQSSDCPLPPGTLGLPFIGETLQFLFFGRSFFDQRRIQHGNVFKTHLLGKATIRVIGTKNARKILMSENTLVESQWPKSTQMLLGEGSLTLSGGRAHTIRKKAILRAFTNEALSGYAMIIQDTIQRHIRQWCIAGFMYGYKEFRSLAFDLSCRVLLGFEMSKEENGRLLENFETFMSNLFSLPICIPGFGLHKGMKARKTMLQKLEKIIKSKLDVGSSLGFSDALSLIMGVEGKERLSTEEAKDVGLELLFAGHETTSSAASTLVLQLSKNKHVLHKIRMELAENGLTSPDADFDIAKINKLKYIHHVVKEALRISPPIGGGYRKALKTFEVDGYQVPKGWSIVYSIRDSHETCDVIDSPLLFDPDRWNDFAKSEPQHFFPFGGGKKGCAGKEFAILMLKIFVVEMTRSCDWNVRNKNPRMKYLPVPHPADNLPMDIRFPDTTK